MYHDNELNIGCVVQGDIRRGTKEVVQELEKHFDVVILSTWNSEKPKLPAGKYELLLNDEPENPGFTHRNYQRLSTARGIDFADKIGCSHIMKWRTDMLPTKLNLTTLLKWAYDDVPKEISARIVTCAFRNLTVIPDYFSSIPDYFSFSDLKMMKLLWGDGAFDYKKNMNPPEDMMFECGFDWLKEKNVNNIFCAETELYAIFKSRLQEYTGEKLDHRTIVKNYFRLINHERLGICWFDSKRGFRSITQATQFPWWKEKNWYGIPVKVLSSGYPVNGVIPRFKKYLNYLIVNYYKVKQTLRYSKYRFKSN